MRADGNPSVSRAASRPPTGLDPWLVALLAPLPFLPALWSGFVADDFFFAALLSELTTPLAHYVLPAMLWMQDVPTTFYRPLAFITLYGEIRAWGGDPWPMHVTNLALHAASAVGVWWLVACLASGPAVRAAALIAALQWAWFPRRVEAVAWLSCRPDVLATALGIWALVAWIWGERRGSLVARVLGVSLWAGALAGKESVAVLPLALLAVDLRHLHGSREARDSSSRPVSTLQAAWRRALRLWPFAVGLVSFLVLRRLALGAWIGGYGTSVLSPSPATALKLFVYPLVPPLEFLGRALQDYTLALVVAGLMGLAALVLWTAVLRSRREPTVVFGAAWIVAGTLPVITLLPSLTSSMNDRLMYLSGAGFALVIGGWLAGGGPRRHVVVAGLVALTTLQTVSLSGAWKLAGEATRVLVERTASIARTIPAPTPLLVAAAPDSYRGAYMLRNGLASALRSHHVSGAERVAVLTHYIVEDFDVMPVSVQFESPGVLRLNGRDGRPHVMMRAAEAAESRQYTNVIEATGGNDPLGRWSAARLALLGPSEVVVLSPRGAERLGLTGHALAGRDDQRPDAAPVRE